MVLIESTPTAYKVVKQGSRARLVQLCMRRFFHHLDEGFVGGKSEFGEGHSMVDLMNPDGTYAMSLIICGGVATDIIPQGDIEKGLDKSDQN